MEVGYILLKGLGLAPQPGFGFFLEVEYIHC